jgi:signal transduction histidine kinase
VKILIADDDRFYRRMLEATLVEWGYEVTAVDNGEAAWKALGERDAPKMAILDWMMPHLDGLEVVRRVRALDRSEPTYLLILTSKDGKQNVISALERGADDYLTKPFDRAELHARLQAGRRIVALQASLATRVRQLEDALSGAAKMEAVGRLAGGIAHDFNNILVVINGYSELLLQETGTNDPARGPVSMIKGAGERAARLTRQLLAFSRKQVLNPVVLGLNSVLSDFQHMLARLIGEDVELRLILHQALPPVKADVGQIEQVIMNLVVNARDAMPHGGAVTLETHVVDPEDVPAIPPLDPEDRRPFVRLSVTDNGQGMDEETQARLFEPFFTTKEVGKGTGLGLATVYGIVKQSGGHIQVVSRPGVGTSFRIYLPSADLPARTTPTAKNPVVTGKGETILLAEDEPGVRDLAARVLRESGYKVEVAEDGQMALQHGLRYSGKLDLLLADVVMPYLDGRTLAERLQAVRPGMKVLYMTGYTSDAFGESGPPEDSGLVFMKPFTPTALARKVREVLDAAPSRPGDRESQVQHVRAETTCG